MRYHVVALALFAALLGSCDLIEPVPASSNTVRLCDNSCRYARDGECDDTGTGGLGYCSLGTDCSDCGTRTATTTGTTAPGIP